MSHSQFHCTGRVYLDLHGLIFETSICYWQDQPGSPCWYRDGGGKGKGQARRSGLTQPPTTRPSDRGSFCEGPRRQAPTGGRSWRERWRPSGVFFLFGRVRETSCLPEEPPRERGGAPGVNRGTPDPAAGSVGGPLGQTGRLGLATEAFGPGGRRAGRAGARPACTGPPRAIEANPQAGGTTHPNTEAGGGPPMAGLGCQSVRIAGKMTARLEERGGETPGD